MQERYWNYMVQLKEWIFYVDAYSDASYKWDQRINIFLAVTSSSSIAAWAIWSKLGPLWAFVIALSQVVTAVKPYFPFNKRLPLLGQISSQLQLLFNKADYQWYKVSNGDYTENEINDILFDLKKQYTDNISKLLESDALPEVAAYRKTAGEKTSSYFSTQYR